MKVIAGPGSYQLHVEKIVDALPSNVPLMDAMRTAISAYAHHEFTEKDNTGTSCNANNSSSNHCGKTLSKSARLPIVEPNQVYRTQRTICGC